jgi:hypothetical protein
MGLPVSLNSQQLTLFHEEQSQNRFGPGEKTGRKDD